MNPKKQSVILAELERDRTQLAPSDPIVAYVRVSSDEQAKRKTIDAQKTEVEAWAKTRGLKLARIAADDGHSGTTISGRPAFSKLLTEVETGKIGTLVVVAPDRLTRADDWTDRARIMQALKAHRTLLCMPSYGDIDPCADTADMMLSQFFVLSSMERKRMRARTFAGKLRSATSGKLIAGRPPFGRTFNRSAAKWGIDEEEAAIYRRIFQLCLEGRSSKETVEILNAEGAPSAGGRWRREIVSRLLRNESAVGDFVQLGHTAQIPPIVDRATFDAAQQKVEGRKYYHGARAAHPRLLSGLLLCAECGTGIHVRDKGNGFVYYLCGTSHPNWTHKDSRARPPCSKVWHKAQPIEDLVWSAYMDLLTDPAKLQHAANRNSKKPDGDAAKEVAAAERELKALDREEENLMRLYRRGLASPKALERQLTEVKRGRWTAEHALSNARAAQDAVARFQSAGSDLAAKLKALAKNFAAAKPEQKRAAMVERFTRSADNGLKLHLDGSITGTGSLLVSAGTPSRSDVPVDTKVVTPASQVLTFRLRVKTA